MVSLGSGKTNLLLNLVKNKRPNIDKIYLCVKGQFKLNYQLLINGKENVGIKKLMQQSKTTKKKRVLILFDDMIGDLRTNKKLSPIVTKLFLRGKSSIFCLFLYHNLI